MTAPAQEPGESEITRERERETRERMNQPQDPTEGGVSSDNPTTREREEEMRERMRNPASPPPNPEKR